MLWSAKTSTAVGLFFFMARKPSYKVEYFPHRMGGEDMEHIQAMFGNDGYAVWFKILERIASTDYHILDLRTEKMISRCASKCLVTKDRLFDILNELALLDEIDSELWKIGIVWSEKFIESVAPVYEKRSNKCLSKIEALAMIGITAPETTISAPETPQSDTGNTQSKVKYSIVNKSEVEVVSTQPETFDCYSPQIEPPPPPQSSLTESQKAYLEKNVSDKNYLPQAIRIAEWANAALKDAFFMDQLSVVCGNSKKAQSFLPDKAFESIGNKKTYKDETDFRKHITNSARILKNNGKL